MRGSRADLVAGIVVFAAVSVALIVCGAVLIAGAV